MPAMIDDPTAPIPPAPTPLTIPTPTTYTLRDGNLATLFPFTSPTQLPSSIITFLSSQFNEEIERGDTYPHEQPLTASSFGSYWFGSFGAVLLLGELSENELQNSDLDWNSRVLGTFYIKPNYPGRCSHVCNAGFLTTMAARGRGIGTVMGGAYVVWAKMLGYTYSVFNLVFETNVASLRIWEGLGFEKIGRVKGAARLKSWPDRKVDAFIIGRDL